MRPRMRMYVCVRPLVPATARLCVVCVARLQRACTSAVTVIKHGVHYTTALYLLMLRRRDSERAVLSLSKRGTKMGIKLIKD